LGDGIVLGDGSVESPAGDDTTHMK
jgi:hypothetical protein